MAKRDLSKSVGNIRTSAPEQNPSETHATDSKKKVNNGRCIWIEPTLYEDVRVYATYRALSGETNDHKQPVSIGYIINEAIREYVSNHQAEFKKARKLKEELGKN